MLSFLLFLSSGLFLGWSLGANDSSNIFGAAVGTKMLRFTTAAIITSAFIILGAVISGQNTAVTLNTLGKINTLPAAFTVSLAAATAVFLMIRTGLTASISQSIVGAILGWNIYNQQPTNTDTLVDICSSWILCPILSGLIAITLYNIIKQFLKVCKLHILWQDLLIRLSMILTAALGGYALGANNMANIVGIFLNSNIFPSITFNKYISLNSAQVLFLLGAIATSIGVFTYSKRTIKTIGNNVLKFSPMVAWIVIISQSLVLLMFASQDLKSFLMSYNLPTLPAVPVSSSQAIIGAILGIGILKGGKGIKWSLVGKLFLGWITTPFMAFILSFIFLSFMENVFMQPVILP